MPIRVKHVESSARLGYDLSRATHMHVIANECLVCAMADPMGRIVGVTIASGELVRVRRFVLYSLDTSFSHTQRGVEGAESGVSPEAR